jgi:hypothetical protein
MSMRALFCAVVWLCVPAFALAQTATGAALALYKAGDYAGAVRAGVAENTENGFAVAARATLAEANLREAPCMECLKRGEGFALRAIAAGGKLPESYVYLAAALGYQSRVLGTLRAGFAQYGDRSREALESALRVNPNFSWALAAMGGWNIEVVRVGGSWMGDLFYDASVEKGIGYFRRAIAAEPANLVIHFQLALALAAYDLDGQRTLVTSELAAAAAGTPASAYDAVIKGRAARLKDVLAKHDDEVALALVRKYQGYPD